MKGLWKYDVMVLAILAAWLAWAAYGRKEEEERVRAVSSGDAALAVPYAFQLEKHPELPLSHPLCPDQWIAQRGAAERWHVKCATASTEGSRAHNGE